MFTLSRAASLVLFVSLCVSSAYGAQPPKKGPRRAGGRPVKKAKEVAASLKSQFGDISTDLKAGVYNDINIELAKQTIEAYVDTKSSELKNALGEIAIGGGIDKDDFLTSFKGEIMKTIDTQIEVVMQAVDDTIQEFKAGAFRDKIITGSGLGDTDGLIQNLKDQAYERVDEAIGGQEFIADITNAAYVTAEEAKAGAQEAVNTVNVEDVPKVEADNVIHESGDVDLRRPRSGHPWSRKDKPGHCRHCPY